MSVGSLFFSGLSIFRWYRPANDGLMRYRNSRTQKYAPFRFPEPFNLGSACPESQQILEPDAEKCEAVSDDIMLYLFDLEPDSDFRSTCPEIIRL
jgi:hypothetical protein